MDMGWKTPLHLFFVKIVKIEKINIKFKFERKN
jgi:hypothetical protein